MGKNAFVLDHHHGDDGTVSEGMILTDVTQKRFDELEKRGLVREATDDEVAAGYQPTIEADPSQADDGGEKTAAKTPNKKAAEPANKAA